jgi:bifunctional non-homologous end joining protein LigD
VALDPYRARRDFAKTPEPSAAAAAAPSEGRRFVLHEHHARRLHWDLRLEHDGVLVSFALPRGVPDDPADNRLAIRTEDHPIAYLDFAGEIPHGAYGAGRMLIRDHGSYELEKFRDDELIIMLHGEQVTGRYALIRTRDDQWLMHRMTPPTDPTRTVMPEGIEPMLAKAGSLPSHDEDYAFEIKWDGVRTIIAVSHGRVRARSRNGHDVTATYPELRGIGDALGATDCILDGEIVALDDTGTPSFDLLQRRSAVASAQIARRRSREVPVTYQVFDLLWLNGHATTSLAYTDRRRLLEHLDLHGPHWQTPAYHVGDGQAMIDASRRLGLEGVVAKRLTSRYEPGRRNAAWIKIKNDRTITVVIGGYTHGRGARRNRIGALAVGVEDTAGQLVYAGRVGSGMSDATLDTLERLLPPTRRAETPFAGGATPAGIEFVEPCYRAVVRYTETTTAGTLRHPRLVSIIPAVDKECRSDG